MTEQHHTSLIIPAYNEGTRIGTVLEQALQADVLDEIIVVNDGSTDDTAQVVESFGIVVLTHEVNLGKGEAMQTGYIRAKELGSTTLLFLDADLHNLLPHHIDDLVNPVLVGDASMTIGILERSPLQKTILKHWGAFSGQRAVPTSLWESVDESFRTGFGIEAALNATSRHLNTHHDIQRVYLSGVTHTGKREKEPTIMQAAGAYASTYGQALLAYARLH